MFMGLYKKYIPDKYADVKHNINNNITSSSVRLINEAGNHLGIFDRGIALNKAKILGLDLVEISSSSIPIVCKLMNYGKFKYKQKRKNAKIKKNQLISNTKEIKFRPKTEDHDLNFKIRSIKKFLLQKKKVKITIVFKGREISYIDIGKQTLQKVLKSVKYYATINSPLKLDGKQLIVYLMPINSNNKDVSEQSNV
jgi:translation initiation factor IF-3